MRKKVFFGISVGILVIVYFVLFVFDIPGKMQFKKSGIHTKAAITEIIEISPTQVQINYIYHINNEQFTGVDFLSKTKYAVIHNDLNIGDSVAIVISPKNPSMNIPAHRLNSHY